MKKAALEARLSQEVDDLSRTFHITYRERQEASGVFAQDTEALGAAQTVFESVLEKGVAGILASLDRSGSISNPRWRWAHDRLKALLHSRFDPMIKYWGEENPDFYRPEVLKRYRGYFEYHMSTADKTIDSHCEGWATSGPKGFIELHPVWWSLIMLIVGALFGSMIDNASKAVFSQEVQSAGIASQGELNHQSPGTSSSE